MGHEIVRIFLGYLDPLPMCLTQGAPPLLPIGEIQALLLHLPISLSYSHFQPLETKFLALRLILMYRGFSHRNELLHHEHVTHAYMRWLGYLVHGP